MAEYSYVKAGGVTQLDATEPFFLYGGESDIVTDRAEVAASQVLAIFTVVAFNTAGRLVAVAPAASDGTQNAVGILAEPVDTTSGVKWCPFFTGGQFNADALVWPAAWDTLAERRAAFARTNIGVHRLP